MKNIVILGSTGSIGRNALSVIREEPQKFRIIGLSARSNVDLLEKQVEEFHPEVVVITDEEAGKRFLLKPLAKKVKVILGEEGFLKLVRS